MIINVTQENIDKGTSTCVWACPIALALRKIAKDEEGVSVYDTHCYIDDVNYNLPPEATSFIQNFDEGINVNPFSFEAIKR